MAFNTRGQNSPPSYLDGISVKISEKYKPPKKINVALSYSQILTLNKLIQDPYPNYDFTLEESIKTRVNEWRKVRSTLVEERKQRLQILSQERNTKKWNQQQQLLQQQQQQQQQNENVSNDTNEVLNKSNNSDSDTTTTSDISNNKDTEVSSTSHLYTTESGVLIPMTSQQQQQHQQQLNLKRPVYQIQHFNFSEFESDTSSPFDNMELKTINDLEELAEVLKRDSDINSSSPIINNTNTMNDQSSNVIENNYINSSSSVVNRDNMYDNNAYAYKGISNSKESHVNGYYYNHHTPIYTSKVLYGNDAIGNDLKYAQAHGSPVRSVTEIMRSLHEQFAANHITESTANAKQQMQMLNETASSTSSSKKNPQIHLATKKPIEDQLDNPYNSLTADLQKMAVTISNMGFPLSRVARACQAFDGNQKKIVEHLLAMSELLDLGFSEENVVSALLKCDNDRDKALDILIT